MKVENTPTGEAVNLDDNPFDMAEIVLPNYPGGSRNFQLSDDLGQGNAATMQPTGNSMTNTNDWSSSSHFNHSNSRQGQGNLVVVRNSNSDRFMTRLYNAVNPLGGRNIEKAQVVARNAKPACFDVVLWNAANPSIHAIAAGCFFQNLPTLTLSNGSNNSQDTSTWTYLATTIRRDEGDISNVPGQNVPAFNVNGIGTSHDTATKSIDLPGDGPLQTNLQTNFNISTTTE